LKLLQFKRKKEKENGKREWKKRVEKESGKRQILFKLK
jgi:hypothetical protein